MSTEETDWETACHSRDDGIHCNHWYDGDPCCACGDNTEVDMEPTMAFSQALDYIKSGNRLQRAGWNGKGMFVFLVPGSTFKVNRPPWLGIYPEGAEIKYHGHIDMRTADGQIVPWLCSQTDMLAEDWSLAE